MKIALTGGIACGKSMAASYMLGHGVEVCEADELARDALAEGTQVYEAVVERFGRELVTESGAIDRQALAARVFRSKEDRMALNALVHPGVEAAWKAWLEDRQGAMAVVVVPLLFETGYADGWDAVICVCALHATRIARLRERGLTEAEAEARISAQWPESEKAARADYVLWNDGAAECLEAQVARVLDSIKRGQ
ncbi:MAG: dephospho-CoA kinase [Kiritimatiellae bacterium]|nr:dephospho-CoA kinase [Kiritimatiellia bacterium]